MEELNRRKAQLRLQGVPLHDFGTGDPRLPTPEPVRQALHDAIPGISQYPTVTGESWLRQAAAGYLQRRFGVDLDPDAHILPTAGSKESVFHAPLVFLHTDSERRSVTYPVPGYPVYERGTLFAGGDPQPFQLEPRNNWCIDIDRIPEDQLRRTALLWVNHPHNPSGSQVDRGYYRHLLDAAREYGFILCSDECYVDIYRDNPPASALQAGIDNLLCFYSTSKRSGMTGYRSGFIAGDPALISRYARFRASMGVASPVFIQAAAAAAWNDDDHVCDRRRIFMQRRHIFEEFFARYGLELASGPGTFFLWVRVPDGSSADAYAARLLDQGLLTSPGGFFGPGCDAYIRLALVPDEDSTRQAIERWKQIL